MSIFKDQLTFVREFEAVVHEAMRTVLETSGLELKSLIVDKQLYIDGERGDGKRLEGYARTTIKIKLRKQQPVDRTTLHDSEEFANSIIIDAFADSFEISSGVSYDKYIIKRYGEEVLHPSQESMEKFMNRYYLPILKSLTTSKLN
ncbi:MAG: hypothetical protein ACPGRW_06355 [Flavobacteriaceae bacterium]